MLRARIICLLACVAATACRATPETEGGPGWRVIFPFDQIGEVSLGMSSRDLEDMRGEHLSVAGYVGYQERSDSFLIRYVFPGSMTEDRPPPPKSRLAAIEAELARPAEAVAFRDAHRRIVGLLGPARCSRVRASDRDRGFIAEWPNGETPLTLFYVRGPTAEVPDELVLRVGSPWEFLSGPLTELEQTECTGP